MSITLHEAFAKNLDLDGSLKARAWDFLVKVGAHPTLRGLDLKLPKNPADRRVRSARVDHDHRAVLFLIGGDDDPHLILAAIKPHDEAYAYAERARLTVNPTSGALELRVLDEPAPVTPPAAAAPAPAPTTRAPVDERPQVLPFSVAELVTLGIDEDVAVRAVALRDEDELLALGAGLPRWQGAALLDLATGTGLDDVRRTYVIQPVAPPPDTDEALVEALERPTTRLDFAVMTGDDELRRALDTDLAAWRVFLHPSQRAAAYRVGWNGPARVTGGAGTGKTVVALHRAAHLAGRTDGRILLCTFTRTLARQLADDLVRLTGAEVASQVDVLGVDQLARRVARDAGLEVGRPLLDAQEQDLWAEAREVVGDLAPALSPAFLAEEHRDVVLAQGLTTEREYLRAVRRGRGTRLDRRQRGQVWAAVEHVRRALAQRGSTTFMQLAADAAAAAADGRGPRYRHAVVDEGQDLHAAHWRLLRALVPPGPDDLFISEDGHQRLYGRRVVLSRLGIETRGRSRRLTLNYRTTREILAVALQVLRDEAPVLDLEGDAEATDAYRSSLSGPTPTLRPFPTRAAEMTGALETIRDWLSESADEAAAGSIGVLLRRRRDAEDLARRLVSAGLPARHIGADDEGGTTPVLVATMHRAKGTEFRRVLVMHAETGTLPEPVALAAADDTDDAEARERFLLYVACSRAREDLVISWAGAPSPFLKNIRIAPNQ